VRVVVRTTATELRVEVRDEGRGIPVEHLEAIFDRFQQVDSSDAREMGGTGLGLAICRTIVEQHGGRIWAESVPGAGTTMTLTLPTRSAGIDGVVDEPEREAV
jgi:signal transduction histidine kinase